MKHILNDVFNDLMSMDDDSFRAILDGHKLGEVGSALNEMWGFIENEIQMFHVESGFSIYKKKAELLDSIRMFVSGKYSQQEFCDVLAAQMAANDDLYALAA